jgi:hypothetical protein
MAIAHCLPVIKVKGFFFQHCVIHRILAMDPEIFQLHFPVFRPPEYLGRSLWHRLEPCWGLSLAMPLLRTHPFQASIQNPFMTVAVLLGASTVLKAALISRALLIVIQAV